MAQAFVKQHREEQWFRERYLPEIRDPLKLQLSEHRRGAYAQWERDLESGMFDGLTLEGIPKSESNGVGGIVEKEEGEATATNEVLGVGDLVPVPTAEGRDENLFQPTLLIKTIAPSVSRQNLEAFCKEHLGEGDGGFKWLSLSDPNPSKRYHRIGWIMLNPTSETVPADRTDPKDDDGDLEIKSPVPVSIAEKALEAINGKTVKDEVRGDFVCHVGVHSPPINPRKKALWDLFSAPERIAKDLQLVTQLVNKFEEHFGSDFNAILKVEEKVEELRNAGRLQPALPASASPISKKVKKERVLGLDEAMTRARSPRARTGKRRRKKKAWWTTKWTTRSSWLRRSSSTSSSSTCAASSTSASSAFSRAIPSTSCRASVPAVICADPAAHCLPLRRRWPARALRESPSLPRSGLKSPRARRAKCRARASASSATRPARRSSSCNGPTTGSERSRTRSCRFLSQKASTSGSWGGSPSKLRWMKSSPNSSSKRTSTSGGVRHPTVRNSSRRTTFGESTSKSAMWNGWRRCETRYV